MNAKPMRQGDVLIKPGMIPAQAKRLSHLVLAEGEVTGHRHQIIDGIAELYEKDHVLYLQVLSEIATLSHEEHHPIQLPQGTWEVRIQRQYVQSGTLTDPKWEIVSD
ncbi:hypothetical protein LEP3755_02910 [Leptolyngbya sp. NIES-3755]|nr:hypothetical protein LEP3755_02910 [Leptolyngbya sp. NIES-3755]